MSWLSGGELADEVWKLVEPHLEGKPKTKIARQIVEAFQKRGCDTMEQCDGFLGIQAHRMRHEKDGAPKSPIKGDTYLLQDTPYSYLFEFDGERWHSVKEYRVGDT